MRDVCRTCLRTSSDSIRISNKPTLIHKIEVISSIKLIMTEAFPSIICNECLSNINHFYNFRNVIINSDKDLREQHEIILQNGREKDFKPAESHTSLVKSIAPDKYAGVPSDAYVYIKEEKEDAETTNECSGNNLAESPGFAFTESESESVEAATKENIIKKEMMELSSEEMDMVKALALRKIHKCKVCDEIFDSQIKVNNHRRTAHYPKSVCNVCGLVIRSDNLRKHEALHWESPVECKICGKVFKNSESLRGHQLLHKEEVFICDICGKTSRVKAEHKRHLKLHEDPEIRKAQCSICGKKVRDLKKHILSHTGEKPYICTICEKGLKSPYALKVHMRQHTNEKPFMCQYCPMAFPQKASLDTHIRAKHHKKLS